MFYEWAIQVPKNTTAAAPLETVEKIALGMIIKVEVQFPAGCAGLAHCKILHQESQVWPTPPSTSFASDNHTITIEENYEITAEPYHLKLVCWNLDDTYDHTLYIRVGLVRGLGAVAINKVFQGLEKMLKLMGIK